MSWRFNRWATAAFFTTALAEGNFAPVGCTMTWVRSRNEGRVDWCTHIPRTSDGGRWRHVSNIVNSRQSLDIPIRPQDEATVTSEIQEKNKCFTDKHYLVSFQIPATLPPYRLRTEGRLRLTGVSNIICLKSSRHGVNGAAATGSVVYFILTVQRAHRSCKSGLYNHQWLAADHPPTIITWVSLPVTGFCSLPSRGSWRENNFREPKMPEHSSRVSFFTYANVS